MTALGWAVTGLRKNFTFAMAMAHREIKGQHKAMMLGTAWQVVRPLINAAVWVVLMVFVAQVPSDPAIGRFGYLTYVLAGMVPWVVLQRGLEEATTLASSRMDLLKNGFYPMETLPVSALVASWAAPVVNMALCVLLAALSGQLTLKILLLPVALALLCVLVIALSWIVMIIGVVLRDAREIAGVSMNLAIFVSPVFLTPDMAGEFYWGMVMANPLSHPVVVFRDVLLGQSHPWSWAVTAAMAVISAVLGAEVLHRLHLRIGEYM